MRVFILLFNPRTDNERIHTIYEAGQYKVLMFAQEDDAARFALLLEAQDFPIPAVEAIDSEEVESFCREAGYECQLVEDGMLAVPPQANLEQDDWDEPTDDSDIPSQDLDKIRRQLEGLL
jgi:hypothetical protein